MIALLALASLVASLTIELLATLHGTGYRGSALGPLRLGRPTAAPAIVFVSRNPVPGAPGAIPGVGPIHRTVATGGRLMVRATSGRTSPLLPAGRFFDVSDPAVSYDGRRIAFAATVARDSAWRIWTVGADGRGLEPLTRSDRVLDPARFAAAASRHARYDDFDPVWLADGRVVFASTRYPQTAEAGMPASNLFIVNGDGAGLARVTSDRNGAEEPSVNPRSGLIVYARWWTSRYLPSDKTPTGVTTDRALAVEAEAVDLWHAIEITPDGDFPRLAGGFPRERKLTMAYQPIVLDDGTLVGVTAEHLGLSPMPGALSVHAFPGGFAAPVSVPAGRRGSRAIVACAPAAIGGKRIVISSDAGEAGDLGLWVASIDGGSIAPLVDLKGTHELDAAALGPRKRPIVYGVFNSPLPNDAPPPDVASYVDRGWTFRFDCLNVFANAPVDVPIPDAPPFQPGARHPLLRGARPSGGSGRRYGRARPRSARARRRRGARDRASFGHADVRAADRCARARAELGGRARACARVQRRALRFGHEMRGLPRWSFHNPGGSKRLRRKALQRGSFRQDFGHQHRIRHRGPPGCRRSAHDRASGGGRVDLGWRVRPEFEAPMDLCH